jgi:ankyrin repeat protein
MRGETPLFLAALNSIWDIAEILIGAGADLTLTDNAGRTPLEVVGLNDHDHDEDRANITIEVLCNGGAVGPKCDELRELRNRDLQIVIPPASQGSKFVPEQKRENAISRSDIKEGDPIIVITEENGAEFFYELATISQWFATKEAEGNRKTNPMSGLALRDQSQVSRWTASFHTGGRVKKTLRNRTKKQQWKRRR